MKQPEDQTGAMSVNDLISGLMNPLVDAIVEGMIPLAAVSDMLAARVVVDLHYNRKKSITDISRMLKKNRVWVRQILARKKEIEETPLGFNYMEILLLNKKADDKFTFKAAGKCFEDLKVAMTTERLVGLLKEAISKEYIEKNEGARTPLEESSFKVTRKPIKNDFVGATEKAIRIMGNPAAKAFNLRAHVGVQGHVMLRTVLDSDDEAVYAVLELMQKRDDTAAETGKKGFGVVTVLNKRIASSDGQYPCEEALRAVYNSAVSTYCRPTLADWDPDVRDAFVKEDAPKLQKWFQKQIEKAEAIDEPKTVALTLTFAFAAYASPA